VFEISGDMCRRATVIFVHNHPNGVCEPSNADIAITKKLKEANGCRP
jgi:DNA repair protein RadC